MVPETSPLRLRTSMAGANLGGASGDSRISAMSAPFSSMPKGAPNARSPGSKISFLKCSR